MEIKSPEEEVKRLLRELQENTPSRLHPKLESLRHQISRISTGVLVLQEWKDEAATDPVWLQYGLTATEQSLMTALKRAGPNGITKARLMAVQYATQLEDWPDIKILDIRICHIRRKLIKANAPWWIETVWGQGWILHEGNTAPKRSSDGKTSWSHPTIQSTHRPGQHNKGGK